MKKDNIYADLNEEQYKAVFCEDKKILVKAAAGSGKTKVLTTRVYRLLTSRVSPYNILCVTFTRAAGIEMKERLLKLTPLAQNVFSNTFHSFCIEILRKYGDRLSLDNNFTIISQERRLEILEDIAKSHNYTKGINKLDAVLSDYYSKKDTLSSNEKLIVDEYKYCTIADNSVDLDMILYYTYQLLDKHEDIRIYYQNQYTHIMIDEYQDTNDIQDMIIRKIDPFNLLCVGDVRQSIYKWRNANPQIILDFEGTIIELNKNYRNTIPIVDAANNLMSNSKINCSNMETSKIGTDIEIITGENSQEQYNYVIADILKNAYSYKDVTVLSRTNNEIKELSLLLEQNGIPFVLNGSSNKFIQNEIIKMIISFIECAINTKNERLVLNCLNYPDILLQKNKQLLLKQRCLKDGKTILEGLSSYKFIEQQRVNNFVTMINNLRQNILQDGNAKKVIEYAVNNCLLSFMRNNPVIKELFKDCENWLQEQKIIYAQTNITAYLDYLKTKDIQDKIKIFEEDKVKLMTIHGSKGLEFPIVYILGLNEGKFPCKNKNGDIEEDRRVFYVAMTRAQEKLKLCWYRNGTIYRNISTNFYPSIFMAQIKNPIVY